MTAAEHAVVRLTTRLDVAADRAFAAVQQPRLLVHVARARFPQLERRVQPWRQGETVTTWVLLFGFIPFSRHHLTIARLDPDRRELESDEHGGVIRRWRHLIRLEPLEDGRSRYTDQVTIDAGPLTPVVRAWAEVFYRHRQRRWRRLARTHLARLPGSRGST